MTKASVPNKAAMIKVIHAVHLQPRELIVMKPPMIGPATGPIKVAPAKRPRAKPLSTGPQKSARAPPIMARGADPNTPPRNRHIIIVSTF